MATKQYLDMAGVAQLWEAIKNYIDNNGSSGEDETEMGMRIFEVEYDVLNGRYSWIQGSYSGIQAALEDGYIPCLRVYSEYSPFRGIYYFAKSQSYNDELLQDENPYNDNDLNSEYDEKTKYAFISTPKFFIDDSIYYTIIDIFENDFISEYRMPESIVIQTIADSNGIRFDENSGNDYEHVNFQTYNNYGENERGVYLYVDVQSENINLSNSNQKLKLDNIEQTFDHGNEYDESYCATFIGQAMDPDSPQIYFINVKWTQNYTIDDEGQSEKVDDTLTFKISKTSDIEYVTL